MLARTVKSIKYDCTKPTAKHLKKKMRRFRRLERKGSVIHHASEEQKGNRRSR
jgi:hypothetical protein